MIHSSSKASLCLALLHQKKESLWQQHKIKIVAATALTICTIALVTIYNYDTRDCIEGFYDDLTGSICEKGEWYPLASFRDYNKYYKLIESCKNGGRSMGCFHKNYYRELSLECKENPTAGLCDGNYDHTAWVEKIYSWVNSRPA